MARLTTKARKSLPASVFAGPNRSFPIPDKAHARAALQDLPRTNKLTADQKARVRSRAKGLLGQ
jgi:hypothetical protein